MGHRAPARRRIVAAGRSSNGTNNDFALARYHADGTLDTGFGGGDGLVTTPVGTGTDEANALVLQPDGKIILAGLSSNDSDNDFALARYDAGGTQLRTVDKAGNWSDAVHLEPFLIDIA